MSGGTTLSPSVVIEYNVTDGTSTRLQDMSEGRNYHGCTLISDDNMTAVIVAGGFRGGYFLKSAELYDLSTALWRQAGELNYARDLTSMATLPGGAVVMGGYNGRVMRSVEQFQIPDNTWTPIRDLKQARKSLAVLNLLPEEIVNFNI